MRGEDRWGLVAWTVGCFPVSSSLGSFVCVVLASAKVLSMSLPGVITSTFSVYIQVETRVLVHNCFCILLEKFSEEQAHAVLEELRQRASKESVTIFVRCVCWPLPARSQVSVHPVRSPTEIEQQQVADCSVHEIAKCLRQM